MHNDTIVDDNELCLMTNTLLRFNQLAAVVTKFVIVFNIAVKAVNYLFVKAKVFVRSRIL
jgi:hypothetical protein